MFVWDYKIKKGWRPKTKADKIWLLERKINYDDWNGLDMTAVKKYLRDLKIHPGKKLIIQAYLQKYGKKKCLNWIPRKSIS